MNAYGLDFHHLGLAVRKPDNAMAFLDGLGYRRGNVIYDPEQNVNVSLCSSDASPDVEVIWPAEGKSPVDGMLSRQVALVYHMCYATDDLAGALTRMEGDGHRAIVLAPPKPAILFEGLKVSFYEVVGFGMIEIIDRQAANP